MGPFPIGLYSIMEIITASWKQYEQRSVLQRLRTPAGTASKKDMGPAHVFFMFYGFMIHVL
jgi:hypothetical protein